MCLIILEFFMPCCYLSRLWSEGVSGGCAMGFLYNYTEKTYMPRSGFSLNFTRVPLFSGKNIPAANTRVLRCLRKWLSVSDLHFSAVSRTSFRVAKEPLSGSDIAFFACRYCLFQPMKRCFSQSDMGSFAGSRVGRRSAMCFSRF